MCAILGGTEDAWDYENAIQVMKHRGPDAQMVCRDEFFNLAFARLSIIDLSMNAMQPMFSVDNNVAIVFNGEIYGFLELREKLIRKGHAFKTSSDTEVVLNAYIEWGEQFIDYIDGMYAIALLDKRKRMVTLYRDRTGIKPLYYFYDGKRFAFASELKGIVHLCKDCSFEYDNTAIYDYMYYQYIPAPKTIYKNVYKLEQAMKLEFDLDKQTIRKSKYWELKPNVNQKQNGIDAEEVKWTVRQLISKSVKKQMIADVPIATFLSGGIDSSVITAEVAEIDASVKAFSMGFEEISLDETSYAKQVADFLKIPQCIYTMNQDECMTLYRTFRDWFDEPFADSTGWPNYMISKEIRKYATVALSGDGGDELFGGYPRYSVFAKNKRRGNINSKKLSDIYRRTGWDKYMPADVNRKIYDDVVEYASIAGFVPEKRWRRMDTLVRERLGLDKEYDPYWHFRQYYHKDLPRITKAQVIEFQTYLPDCLLTKVDRTSMAVSLETRVPFLAQELVEYVFALPESVRCTNNDLKKILKEVYIDVLPEEILYRKKKGFTTPENYYKKGEMGFRESALRDIWKIKVI